MNPRPQGYEPCELPLLYPAINPPALVTHLNSFPLVGERRRKKYRYYIFSISHNYYNITIIEICVHVTKKKKADFIPPSFYLMFCNFVMNFEIISLSSGVSASRCISLIFSVKSSMYSSRESINLCFPSMD